MLIAESFELDTGLVVLIVVIALGSLLVAAIVTGLLGVVVGVAIARRSQSPAMIASLAPTKRYWVGIVGVAATLAAWIVFFAVGVAVVDNAWGVVLVWLGGFLVAGAWGWWAARSYRFGDADR